MIARSRKPHVIAHRGASGYAPETTLEGYRLALQMGADGIEMDVHRLRDGAIVAFHDPDVKRTTNGQGPISEFTLSEIKALDAGSWFNDAHPEKARPEYAGLKVPTFQEIIDLTKESSVELYVEIKDPDLHRSDLESSAFSIVRDNGMLPRTRFLSFSAQSIQRIKALDPSAQTTLLVARPEMDPVQAALRASADELGILYKLATPALLKAVRDNHLLITVWTVDEQAEMLRMIQLGVDRITTNYPDRLIQLLDRTNSL